MPKQTEALLQRNVFARRAFTYGHYCGMISDGGHAYGAKEFSKHSFTTAVEVRDAFRGKGLAQRKPTLQFDLSV